LFGFDFTVEYRLGRLKTVAGALSRRETKHTPKVAAELGAMCVRSGSTFAFLDDVHEAMAQAPNALDMLQHLGAGKL
jgi:hypothetical protein